MGKIKVEGGIYSLTYKDLRLQNELYPKGQLLWEKSVVTNRRRLCSCALRKCLTGFLKKNLNHLKSSSESPSGLSPVVTTKHV